MKNTNSITRDIWRYERAMWKRTFGEIVFVGVERLSDLWQLFVYVVGALVGSEVGTRARPLLNYGLPDCDTSCDTSIFQCHLQADPWHYWGFPGRMYNLPSFYCCRVYPSAITCVFFKCGGLWRSHECLHYFWWGELEVIMSWWMTWAGTMAMT